MIAKLAILSVALVGLAQDTSPPNSQEQVWIGRNREEMTKRLKDPNSAEFQNEYVSRLSGSPVVCGEVNAKNGFGGRNGFQRWIGAIPVGVFLEQDVADFQKLWDKTCKAPKNSSKPKEHLPLAR